MYGISLNGLVCAIPIIFFYLQVKLDVCVFFLIIAILFIIFNIVIQIINTLDQIADIESIYEIKNNKVIYLARKKELSDQAILYLKEVYPEHEKELFKMMAEKNSNALINVIGSFPEIKSAGLLNELVTKTQNLTNSVYEQDIRIEKLKRRIRIRKRNPYIFGSFLPTYEPDSNWVSQPSSSSSSSSLSSSSCVGFQKAKKRT